MVGLKIELGKKNITWVVLLFAVLVVGVVYALTPGVAPNPGHLITEVAPPAGCEDGQILQFIDEDNGWGCVVLPSGGGDQNLAVFSNPGSYIWTCPVGVTTVLVEMWGAGGGGGGYYSGSTGGGGGAYVEYWHTVVSGLMYSVVVGQGGAGGRGTTHGINGGDTKFNNVIVAGGGERGNMHGTSPQSGGGGVSSHFPGQNGGSRAGMIGGKGAGLGGPGGKRYVDGVFPGGGGAGAVSIRAGSGANGVAILRW